jgi:hypothetical protein
MNAMQPMPESLSFVQGGASSKVYSVCDESTVIVNEDSGRIDVLPFNTPDKAASPNLAVCERLDLLLTASPSGKVFAYRISNRELRWSQQFKGYVSCMAIVEASKAVVICAGSSTTKVISIEDGAALESPLNNHHSHLQAGAGCVCVKNRTQETYCFREVSPSGMFLDLVLPSLKNALDTPHFLATTSIEGHGEVLFFDPVRGSLLKRACRTAFWSIVSH